MLQWYMELYGQGGELYEGKTAPEICGGYCSSH